MNEEAQNVWLGLDIGGANVKAADSMGKAINCEFPLWRRPSDLTDAISELVRQFPSAQQLAVTMTGELADCYATKREGVCSIVDAAVNAWTKAPPVFYTTEGNFIDAENARGNSLAVAAANWHALANYVARLTTDSAILIDIGSTTTDIIPIENRQVAAGGLTDTARLIHGELVYTGIGRTPVASMVSQLRYRGDVCGVARELFATTLDVYLTLGNIREIAGDRKPDTADGRAADKRHALGRLARMICADSDSFDEQDAFDMAVQIARAQETMIGSGLAKVAGAISQPVTEIIVSGEGEFLAREVATHRFPNAQLIELSEHFNSDIAAVAPAFAVAHLAADRVLN